ncbi:MULTISPECIES: PAAR-like protein [unclassified Streptomyces]|uniref:PAAR-like protein n=1 Tax=unclassified Streptomyces TaxID=2593676 RepID=UPI001CD3620D|nr:PAAR-like protein [Streptomyces sp. CoH27]
MSGNLVTISATVLCPHGGQANVLPAQSRVLVDGSPAATEADVYTVTGCTFTAGGKADPCTTVRWTGTSARIRINGSPALLQDSTALCHTAEGATQGPPNVTVVQQRVVGR